MKKFSFGDNWIECSRGFLCSIDILLISNPIKMNANVKLKKMLKLAESCKRVVPSLLAMFVMASSYAVPTVATAEVVPVNLNGSISSITYSSCISLVNGSCTAWNFTYPTSANAYNGANLRIGARFSAMFSYDSDAPSVMSDDGYQAVFLSAVTGGAITLADVSLPSENLPESGSGSYSVVDGRYGSDGFLIQQFFSSGDWFGIMELYLNDRSGTVFTGFQAPTLLNPALFDYQAFALTFLQRSTGDQVRFSATGQNLEVVVPSLVPEPASIALVLIAIAGLFVIRPRGTAAKS